MVKAAAIIALTLMLAGCKSELGRAQTRYETARHVGDSNAECQAAKDAMDAALSSGDQKAYADWREKATMDCSIARLLAASERPTDP